MQFAADLLRLAGNRCSWMPGKRRLQCEQFLDAGHDELFKLLDAYFRYRFQNLFLFKNSWRG